MEPTLSVTSLSQDRICQLEQIINNNKNNSELNLSFKGLIDQDMENTIVHGLRNSIVSDYIHIYKSIFHSCST